MQIVLARMQPTFNSRTMRWNERPVAMMWKIDGTITDASAARAYAAAEGYEVMRYPSSESEPLIRAREALSTR